MTVLTKRTIVLILSSMLIILIFPTMIQSDQADSSTRSGDDDGAPDVGNFTQLWMEGYGDISSLVYSSDGSELAISAVNGGIYFFNTSDYSLVRKFIFRDKVVAAMDWTSDGSKIAISSGYKITILDPKTGYELFSFENNRGVNYLKWSPNGSCIATGQQGKFKIFDAETGNVLLTVDNAQRFAWSPDSSMIAFPSDWNVTIINAITGEMVKTLFGEVQNKRNFLSSIGHIEWSPDGSRIAFESIWFEGYGYHSKIYMFDFLSGGLLGTTATRQSWDSWPFSWSPDGTRIVTLISTEEMGIYYASNLSVSRIIDGQFFSLTLISWSPGGYHIALTGYSVWLYVIDTSLADRLIVLQEGLNRIEKISWAPDDKHFAALCTVKNRTSEEYEGRIKIIDSKTGELTNYFNDTMDIDSISWSPKGDEIAYTISNVTKIINADTGALVRTLPDPGDIRIFSIAWSPNGEKMATGSTDNNTKIWNVESGELLLTLTDHTDHTSDITWSPDGTSVASGSYDGTIAIWNATNGELMQIFSPDVWQASDGPIWSISWSPDGNLIAGSYRFEVGIWNIYTGDLIRVYDQETLHLGSYSSSSVIEWSPDGSKLAVRGSGVIIWHYPSNDVTILNAPSDLSLDENSFAWSSDGTRLACGYYHGVVRMWGSPADISISRSDIAFLNDDPKIGDELTVSITVHNYGRINATDINLLICIDENVIDEQMIDFLEQKGGSKTIQTSFDISKKTHIITIEGDPYDSIPEFNETNNIGNNTINVREQDEIQEYFTIVSFVIILMILILYLFIRSRKANKKG